MNVGIILMYPGFTSYIFEIYSYVLNILLSQKGIVALSANLENHPNHK